MNVRQVIFALGRLLQVLAGAMVIPAAIAYAEAWPIAVGRLLVDGRTAGFLYAIIASLIAGTLLALVPKEPLRGNAVREGFAIVTFGWLVMTLFGCLPLFFYFVTTLSKVTAAGLALSFTDAFFEIMSGLTTTGATILRDIETVPRGLLFWRSMTHWLGGMGIVTLVLAVFPAFGIAAYQMFRGEVPGPTAERLRPRLAQTAKVLWWVYALLTFAEVGLLYLGGMSLFDAFCHAFGTMATGGFSSRNASLAAYDSAYIHWVVLVFMVLAGTNFMLHYNIIFSGRFNVLTRDREYRFYIAILAIAAVLGTTALWGYGIAQADDVACGYRHPTLTPQEAAAHVATQEEQVRSPLDAFRHVAFQVVSVTTTTGYTTADFDIWPGALRLMLVVLMFFGGCAGSTAGGVKMIRILVILKATLRNIRSEVQPRSIVPVKIGGRALNEKQIASIVSFFVMFVALFVVLSLIMSFIIPDFTTAVTSVVATLCNIGPGLGGIGATQTYAWIPLGGKWVLCLSMLLGRLEIYTVLIAISPLSWRR